MYLARLAILILLYARFYKRTCPYNELTQKQIIPVNMYLYFMESCLNFGGVNKNLIDCKVKKGIIILQVLHKK